MLAHLLSQRMGVLGAAVGTQSWLTNVLITQGVKLATRATKDVIEKIKDSQELKAHDAELAKSPELVDQKKRTELEEDILGG